MKCFEAEKFFKKRDWQILVRTKKLFKECSTIFHFVFLWKNIRQIRNVVKKGDSFWKSWLQHCCLDVSLFRASFKGRFCTRDCKRGFGGICTRNFSLFSFFSPSLQHKWRRRLRIDFQVLQTLSHTLYFLGASTDTHTRANSSCSYTLRTYVYLYSNLLSS